MAKEIKKYIRITEEMVNFIEVTAKKLNVSENDVYKMIIFDYIRNTKNGI